MRAKSLYEYEDYLKDEYNNKTRQKNSENKFHISYCYQILF